MDDDDELVSMSEDEYTENENDEDDDDADDTHLDNATSTSTTLDAVLPDNDDLVEYDVERSTEHSYLGPRLDRVSGNRCLDDGQTYKLALLLHSVVIFPGDFVPMMKLNELDFLTTGPRGGGDNEEEDGLMFGLVFPRTDDNRYFGVTCQIFEMDSATGEAVRIKSRTRQRFEICRKHNPLFFEDGVLNVHRLTANVTILPETLMGDPLYGNESTSLSKFRYNAGMQPKLRTMCSATLAWPRFVYDMYDTQAIIVRIKSFLSAMQISKMPADDVALSYWCGKNVLMEPKDRWRLFRTNSITERMLIISKSLDYSRYFVCKRCHCKLAHYNSLFAMSSEGFQSSYCNPGGFIHETNTVRHVIPSSVHLQGAPSLEFSWFPGYAWQIALCAQCNTHLGWKFSAAPAASNLRPMKFFGLAGRSIALWKDNSVERIE